jgi:hypothetical protein
MLPGDTDPPYYGHRRQARSEKLRMGKALGTASAVAWVAIGLWRTVVMATLVGGGLRRLAHGLTGMRRRGHLHQQAEHQQQTREQLHEHEFGRIILGSSATTVDCRSV